MILLSGSELALPRANIIPTGNPKLIAMEAKIIFNRNPPHKLGLGPSPISNSVNIIGRSKIHKVFRLFWEYF